MPSKPAISVKNLSKCYQLYAQPIDRLKQFLWRGRRQYFREFWALRDVSFEIAKGEVLGIIGRNGAGKSTLLQLLCGTLNPTDGSVNVQGRIAALLELGSGFNPEFSGRENVYLSASILGLSQQEIDERFEAIVDFSGIRDFIDQPVKTYSSGMYVRLAFSVATSVDPDILVIDEALSVGDGAFARKSFDRIMAMKDAGKTILFCSHSLFQVEAICNRAIWLDQGAIQLSGAAHEVAMAYEQSLIRNDASQSIKDRSPKNQPAKPPSQTAWIVAVTVAADQVSGKIVQARSLVSDVSIKIEFASDITLPLPNLAVTITTEDGRGVCMAGSQFDDVCLNRDDSGHGSVSLVFPAIPLARGNFFINVFLGCENSIYVYDSALQVAQIKVSQNDREQGIVKLPHYWIGEAPSLPTI